MADQPYTTSTGAAASAAEDVNVLGKRVLATIVDAIVLVVVLMIVSLPLTFIGAALEDGSGMVSIFVSLISFVVQMVLIFGYYIYLEGTRGQTVGKMVMGIKVVKEGTGEAPGMKAAAIRTLLRIVDGFMVYLVALLVAMSSQKRQRLGDMAAHTLVVRSGS